LTHLVDSRLLASKGLSEGLSAKTSAKDFGKVLGQVPKNLIITALFRNQPFDSGSSAINRLARSARASASFASYAHQLLSNTEIVSRGPERHSDLGKAET